MLLTGVRSFQFEALELGGFDGDPECNKVAETEGCARNKEIAFGESIHCLITMA
jgi:hypothetical protein